ncbi:MAG: NAD-dependent epimerase/dehydratase family protein [Steroidobacteraceae bacterium]
MSLKLAIIGANGFIGSRAVEWLHLGGQAEVRPIVRSINSLARLSRFDLDCRIADARDQGALRAALEGCEAVVHAVAGDPATILGSLTPTYLAAQEAGVKRFIYLSSASVHGQAPAPGTDETTPLKNRQPIAYNNAKVRAERRLLALRKTGGVELVILRPGIVVGPRSWWISSFVSSLLAGDAYLVNRGRGICNSIYVDNLVQAIYLAARAPRADGRAFLVGDAETISWADLYRPVGDALGFDLGEVPNLEYVKPPRLNSLVRRARTSVAARYLRTMVPKRVRRGLRAALTQETPPLSPWAESAAQSRAGPVSARVTLEMALLYQCAYKLPHAQAQRMLGYEPSVPFAEACRRTLGWLEFSGCPVRPFTCAGKPVL